MTYVRRELGTSKKPIHERLIKTDDGGEYKGILYTLRRARGKFTIVYEGLSVNPFITTKRKLRLKESYVAEPLSSLDFIVARADLWDARNADLPA